MAQSCYPCISRLGKIIPITPASKLCEKTKKIKLVWRSDRMGDISQLNTMLDKVRVARLQYLLSTGDEGAAQNVQTNLEAFIAEQQKLIFRLFFDPQPKQ